MSKTWIGKPPRDGREYDNQCARCGSSLMHVECEACGGEGVSGHECGDDTCCCLDPDENMTCDYCFGRGGYWRCLSPADWCVGNPREGRERYDSGTPEWFVVGAAASKTGRVG